MPKPPKTSKTTSKADLYAKAGVDVVKGDALVDWLLAKRKTSKPGLLKSPFGNVVSGIGGFAALFQTNFKSMRSPLLIASTDGIGTKLLLGIEHAMLSGLGFDLVAMCVNDLYTVGGRPLFFLDYFATGKIDQKQFKTILASVQEACEFCSTPLLGGETAEMPGLYGHGHFDMAGFVVGVVDGEKLLGPKRVKSGDALYALPSSGFHSNGFSLIRNWLEAGNGRKKDLRTRGLVSKLMIPTRIYREIPELVDDLGTDVLHAAANITGGGISGNLPRVIPPGMVCEIDPTSLPTPAFMKEFISSHTKGWTEVEHVFNFGAGMILAVQQNGRGAFERAAKRMGLGACEVGRVVAKRGKKEAYVSYV